MKAVSLSNVKLKAGILHKIITNKIVTAFFIAILLYLLGGIISPGFLEFTHFMNILSLSAYLGIIALGQTLVILSGEEGFDLSVGAVISLSVCVAAQTMTGRNEMLILAALLVLSLGFGLGCINGVGVSFMKIPPLVMTLAMASVIQGLTLIFTDGQPKGSASDILKSIGTGRTLDIPHIVLVWAVVAALAIVFLSLTRWGKKLYAIGENNMTAQLSGVRTRVFRMFVYGISGAISAFAGLFLLGYTGTAYLDIGSKYVMPSVAAVVIGGVSLAGGNGKYTGVIAGVIVLTTLGSILVSLKMGEGGRQIVYGLVLLLLLAAYTRKSRAV